jgi:catechol 2,3-dioxygenase
MSPPTLPATTRMGCVRLRVRSLDRQRAFYRDVLGFDVLEDDGATAVLGAADDTPLVELRAAPDAPRRPARATGLFHVAFLHPTRADLAATLHRVRREGYRLDGFADHNVSEAAYLTDPEGNGIELYVDRPRGSWTTADGRIHITTEPLDLAGLLETAPGPSVRVAGGTLVGHVHLRVSSLAAAEAFYVDHLGFGVVTRAYPGALFVSAGGYHHHLGLNVWGGRATPPPERSLGLVAFDVVVPEADARARILERVHGAELLDPDGNGVRVVAG